MTQHMTHDHTQTQHPLKAGWSVKTWGNAAGDLSRATVNRLIAANKIESVLRGGRRIILTSPEAYLRGGDIYPQQ